MGVLVSNGKILKLKDGGGIPTVQPETWVINETPNDISSYKEFNINFTSNNTSFTGIWFDPYGKSRDVISYNSTNVYGVDTSGWTNTAYRTITFETAPTGELLTWLQQNAIKQ